MLCCPPRTAGLHTPKAWHWPVLRRLGLITVRLEALEQAFEPDPAQLTTTTTTTAAGLLVPTEPIRNLSTFHATDVPRPITGVALSKARIVFTRSNSGIVGSDSTWVMDVSVSLVCVCAVLCVQVAALRRADAPSNEFYRPCKRSRNWETARPQQTAVESVMNECFKLRHWCRENLQVIWCFP
jgi:hypothetical protein